MIRKASLWLVAAAVLFFTAQLGAHHSISPEFDTNKPIKFTGKGTQVECVNPRLDRNAQQQADQVHRQGDQGRVDEPAYLHACRGGGSRHRQDGDVQGRGWSSELAVSAGTGRGPHSGPARPSPGGRWTPL